MHPTVTESSEKFPRLQQMFDVWPNTRCSLLQRQSTDAHSLQSNTSVMYLKSFYSSSSKDKCNSAFFASSYIKFRNATPVITCTSLLLFIRCWGRTVSESSELLTRYQPLCQPLAYNLCFHTLKALRWKQPHYCAQESFLFESVHRLINRNDDKLSAAPRPLQVFEQKKRNKEFKESLKAPIGVEVWIKLQCSLAWNVIHFKSWNERIDRRWLCSADRQFKQTSLTI